MKITKKKVFVMALAVSLVAILSFATLAWFSAEDDVTNKFNFATSEDTDVTDFGVDIYEVDKDGKEYDVDPENGGITYENIIPGDELVKKAFVKNISTTAISATGNTNYSQFVRATVKISDGGVIHATSALDALATVNAILDFDPAWTIDSCVYDGTAKEYVVVLYGNDVLEPNTEAPLFTTVTVPNWLTVENANEMGDTFSISVKAEAVQSDNTGYTTAKDAFVNLVD